MAIGDFKQWATQGQDAPASVARKLGTALLNEGVVDVAGDSFKVAENTGSDMNIQIGSGTVGDLAVVEGDDTAGQGVYVVEAQNGTVTRAVAASDPSDDRIDLVVLQNYDDEADSSGNNDAEVEVIEGTPAGSPSAPAVPDSAISLATISVGAGVTAITNADITDTREEATLRTGLLGNAVEDFTSSSESTSSTSYTNLATTGPSVTVDTGSLALVGVSGRLIGDSAGSRPTMGFQISGATSQAADENLALQHEQNAANSDFFSGTYTALVSLTPGSNTFIAKYANVGGIGNATFHFRRIWVVPL